MRHFLLSAILFLSCIAIPYSAIAKSYFGEDITIKYGEQITVKIGDALKEAMNSYGAGYPYSWKSSNSNIFRTTMPQRTSCTLYACGVGTTTLTYHGEYYRNGVINDIDCTWIVTVEPKDDSDNTGNTPNSTYPEDNLASWQDYGNYDITWYSKSASEFTLATPQQLAGLAYLTNHGADFAGQTINIANDIDLAGKTWVAINGFDGVFDGQGHTISHLNIIIPVGSTDAGFFGALRSKSIVRNLNLQGVLDAKRYCKNIGGFAGSSSGKVENVSCYIPINVYMNIGDEREEITIGGFVGNYAGSSLSHSKYDGNVYIRQSPNSKTSCFWLNTLCGGFIGKVMNGRVEFSESNCNEISINRTSESQALNASIGGFIGYIQGSSICFCNRSIVDSINLTNSDWQGIIYIGSLIAHNYQGASNYTKTLNSFAVVNRFSISSGVLGSTKYTANDCNINTETFCNSETDGLAYVKSRNFNIQTRTLEFMRSPGFLEELNMYSILNLDGAIWEMGDDGFPQLRELHLTDGISTPQIEEQLDKNGIYSLTGVKQQSLLKGLNIVRGKKVIVK